MTNNSDSEHESDFQDISDISYRQIQQKAEKVEVRLLGYADGVTEGKESTFQQMFDCGYADGFRLGFELEKLKAFYDHVGTKINNEELMQEKDKYAALQIAATESQTHFQYSQRTDEDTMASITERQNLYADKLLQNCAAQLPLSSSLFTQNVNNI